MSEATVHCSVSNTEGSNFEDHGCDYEARLSFQKRECIFEESEGRADVFMNESSHWKRQCLVLIHVQIYESKIILMGLSGTQKNTQS